MGIPKGFKYTEEQLAKRKRKQKGKWSKQARERHSVRMKARFAALKKNNVTETVKEGHALSINNRLELIEFQVKAIRKQLGG